MPVKGQIAQFSYGERNDVFSRNHPHIVLDVNLSDINSAVNRGTVIGKDSNGAFVVYDPEAKDPNGNPVHTPYGVLIEDYDPNQSTSAKVLVFGVVYNDAVNVKGNPPSSDDIQKLFDLNIYVVNRA